MMATSWARCAQAAKRAGRVSWALKMLKLEVLQLSITARIARQYNPTTPGHLWPSPGSCRLKDRRQP